MSTVATELAQPRATPGRRPLERPPIWSRAQRVAIAIIAVAGAAVVIVGWVGASGTTDWDDQVGWTAVGVLGAVIGASAAACWLMVGFGAVHYRARYLRSVLAPAVRDESSDRGRPDPVALRGTAVSADSMTRYHRADCSLVRGKPTLAGRIEELEARGRRPCGVCKP